jgi:hypothetical protein
LSGYGPAVSDGVTAHVPVVPPLVVVDVLVLDGLVGDVEPQAFENAAPTLTSAPSAWRRLTRFVSFIVLSLSRKSHNSGLR